jgi:hypothetical protein
MFKSFFISIALSILFFSKSHGQFITNDCSNCTKPIAPGLITIPKINNKEALNSEIYKNHENAIKSSKWLSHESKSVVRNNFGKLNFSILMAPKPCPTNYRWYWGSKKYEEESYTKFKKNIEEKLSDYPYKTINMCNKKNYLILNNEFTNHLNNLENLTRTTGTMVWEKDAQKIILKIIVESNYLNQKPKGTIYNQSLEKICDTYTKNQGSIRKVKLNCIGLSEEIKAIVNVTDFKTGKFKAFGEGGGYKVFLTNLGLKDAKIKYPEIFND